MEIHFAHKTHTCRERRHLCMPRIAGDRGNVGVKLCNVLYEFGITVPR